MYMNFITTTGLRTKSSDLVESLKNGKSVSLIHRSKVVGVISPTREEPRSLTKADINKMNELATRLNLPKISYKNREKSYRKHLLDKYGKGIS